MKTLMRMKLINWHRFHNETIVFGDSVLISGENGAGKSTLLDAIQFVITASKHNFNKAAHENGKRKLTGYVRCKTGKENKPYERTGQVTAHIALEFYDESRKIYFIVGAVVDSASEDSETCVWYRMEGVQLRDEFFVLGNVPKNIEVFRNTNKKYLKMIDRTQSNVKKDFKGRFGRLEDKFFELIPKSLAFKPIDDIKDFVYSYVLDQKEVNIEELKENVRTYQELEILLETIRIKIEKLEGIKEKYRQVMEGIKRDGFYEYYIARADMGINEEQISAEERMVEKCKIREGELQEEEKRLKKERESKAETIQNLMVELSTNEEFLAIQKIEEKIKRFKDRILELEQQKKKLMGSVKTALKSVRELSGIVGDEEVLRQFTAVFADIEKGDDFVSAQEVVKAVIDYKKKKSEEVNRQRFYTESQLEKLGHELTELNHKIENLSNKKLDYGPFVTKLQLAIKENLVHLGRNRDVRVLCELLTITDEKWRNAIEGYLNTQKFYLLVEPEDFDVALSIYEKMKESHGMHGVGIINARKLEEYDQEKEGSIATKITSQSLYAKRFINMLLNNVMMCEHPSQLKMYNKAITASCVRYQNRVAVVLNPKTYEVPFIGENAYKVQLQKAKLEQAQRLSEIHQLEKQVEEYKRMKGHLAYDAEVAISYELCALSELRFENQALEHSLKEKKRLESNSTIMLKQLEIEKRKEALEDWEQALGRNQKWQGENMGKIADGMERIRDLSECGKKLQLVVRQIEDKLSADAITCKSEYERRAKDRELSNLRVSYEQTRKGNWTKKINAEQELVAAMSAYKSEHDFGAEASLQGYRAFEETYTKLKNSELLTYEEKVQRAKLSAEEEFREQFLSKLQENIRKAHGEFNQLNKALKSIPFGSDYYKFEYTGSKKYKMYYDMIMDDFNVIDGISLLSSSFNDRHKEVIEELFSKLTAEGENSNKILEEFTDYRTYMDYDIRIDHGNDEFSYYSKVCEEKSGGETQTPFYVTVAASFMQLYSGGIGGDAIGLILLDEAFNNMDDERIAGVLEFFKKLPLQIVIAAPPDKIQYIQPSIKHTLLVLKEGERSYVEGFAYEKI